MNKFTSKILGIVLIVIGIGTALTFGQNQGFSAGVEAGAAYILGFVLAFIGAFFLFIFGRERKLRE